MYEVYLGEMMFPVAPEKIVYKMRSRNSVTELINMEEISRINAGGLTEYSFDVLLPGGKVPYAKYAYGYREPYDYIHELEEMMQKKEPVTFRLERKKLPMGRNKSSIRKTVTLEGFSVTESAEDGFDVWVGIVLRDYGAAESVKREGEKSFTALEENRMAKKSAESYVVKEGDSLWKICRKELNDGSRAYEIAKLNGISNPDLIYPGQVIKFEQA